MPAKNELKIYIAGGYYHLYNRGVEKRLIFMDDQDYRVFLHCLKECLSPLEPDPLKIQASVHKNLFSDVTLFCYVLMPNHFHLFVKQRASEGIEVLMRSIMTRYVKYFNYKYRRQGHLFQGRYKAVRVDTDEFYLYLTKYIHRNPVEIWHRRLSDYPYSSYAYYCGKKKAEWLHPEEILGNFPPSAQRATYVSFIEDGEDDSVLPMDMLFDSEDSLQ